MDKSTSARLDVSGATMRRILLFDAAWDFLLGIAILSLPWTAEPLLGFRLGNWWPLAAISGVGCMAFAGVLVRGAGGARPKEICTIAAIANGLGAGFLMAIVALVPGLDQAANITLLVVALVCGGFAFIEWRQVRP